jgi:hypothetical protein
MSPSASTLDLIHQYYAQKPNFSEYIGEEQPPKPPTDQLEQVNLNEPPYLKHYLGKRKMPVHPAEENATGSMFDPS